MLKSFSLPLVILGFVLFLFGFISVTSPNMSVLTLMVYLAYMLVAVGTITTAVGIIVRKTVKSWWLPFIIGILLLALGVSIYLNASVSATYYTTLIAIWAAFMGAALIVAALFQKQLKVVLIVNGLMSLGFGCVIYANPFTGTNMLNFMVGSYTILLSVMMVYVAFKLNRPKKIENIEP
ncbi:MAG: DUF308 domain-containing protein [Bacteroidota bacterium]